MSKEPLLLIPVPLGKTKANNSLPPDVIRQIHETTTFFVENIQSAVRFFQWIEHPVPDFKMAFYDLDKHTPPEDLAEYSRIIGKEKAGILSEAGAPGVADPGAKLVQMAHIRGVPVVPLVGPSSILLAVMGAGFNGQTFTFNGYLPINAEERQEALRRLERQSEENGSTQIFMEAPYRNDAIMKDAIDVLKESTEFCVASSLTLENERIQRYPISFWKSGKGSIPENEPAIFLLYANKIVKRFHPKKKSGKRKKKR